MAETDAGTARATAAQLAYWRTLSAEKVVELQAMWERQQAILAMYREVGSYTKVAAHYGLNKETVRFHVLRAQRKTASPVEKHAEAVNGHD